MKKKRLLVPMAVSIGSALKKGGQIVSFRRKYDGTKAFVEKQGPFYRGERGASTYGKLARLKRAAFNSQYFIKPVSKRALKIMEFLEKNGVAIERPIQDLRNGTMLFEKTGCSVDSRDGFAIFSKNREKTLARIGKAVCRMHSLGVSHNHLHAGNIALTKKGEVILLDFGKATISSKERMKKDLNAKSIIMDLFQAADSIASVEQQVFGFGEAEALEMMKKNTRVFLDQYPKELIKKIKKANQQIRSQLGN